MSFASRPISSSNLHLRALQESSKLHRNRVSFADKIHVLIVAAYVSIAGIFWFPGVPHELIPQIKLGAFGILVFVGLLQLPKLPRARRGFILALGLCGAFAFFANALTTDVRTGFDQARDFVGPMLWMIALYGVRTRAYPFLLRALTVGMTGFVIIALYPVAAYLGVLPNIDAPASFFDAQVEGDTPWVVEARSVVGGGFAGQSTTWGVVVPSGALLTASLYLRGTLSFKRAIAIAVVIGSIASIAVTSARGGTLTLTAVAVYGIAVARGVRLSNIVLLGCIGILAAYLDVLSFLPDNFFRGFNTSGDAFTILNSASTGRIASYLGALEHFISSPIVGVGPQQAKVATSQFEVVRIHNTYLKILAESGLIVFVPLVLVTVRLISLAFEGVTKLNHRFAQTPGWPDTRLVILSGIILSLVEPGTIFGTFNATATFWTGVWMALSSAGEHGLPARHVNRQRYLKAGRMAVVSKASQYDRERWKVPNGFR